MNPEPDRPLRRLWLLAVLLLVFGMDAGARNLALLVGINQYAGVQPLEGAVNDATELRSVLIERWGFAAQDIVTLLDVQATRAAILHELDRLLIRSRPGDLVLVYFSGHGTSGRDRGFGLPLPYSTGAFVPVEFKAEGTREEMISRLLVGRTDLRPRIEALDRGGRQVLALIDACYSGNTLRGLYRNTLARPAFTKRYVALPPRSAGSEPAAKDPDLCGYNCASAVEEAFPYRAVAYVSSASEGEAAVDLGSSVLASVPTYDGRPHGAFSDALLRALRGEGPLLADRDGDGRLSAAELHQVTLNFLRQRGLPHTPQLLPRLEDDRSGIAAAIFLQGTPRSGTAPAAPAAGRTLRVQLVDATPALTTVLQGLAQLTLVERDARLIVRRDGEEWQLQSAAGDEITRLPATGIKKVVAAVRAQAWVERVLAAPQDSGFRLELELSGQARGSVAVGGQSIHFAVRSAQPAQLLVLTVSTDGSVAVLYPGNAAELQPVPAGTAVRIPSVDTESILVQAPFGTDQVLAFAFPHPEPRLRELIGGFWESGAAQLEALGDWLGDPALARAQLSLVTRPGPGS